MGNINLDFTNRLYPSLISKDGAVNKTFAENILATQNLIFLSPINFVQSIERLEQLASNDAIKYSEIIPFFQFSEESFADIGLNQITAQSIDKLTQQPLNSFIDSTKIDLSETPSSLLSTLFSRLIQNKLEMRVFSYVKALFDEPHPIGFPTILLQPLFLKWLLSAVPVELQSCFQLLPN